MTKIPSRRSTPAPVNTPPQREVVADPTTPPRRRLSPRAGEQLSGEQTAVKQELPEEQTRPKEGRSKKEGSQQQRRRVDKGKGRATLEKRGSGESSTAPSTCTRSPPIKTCPARSPEQQPLSHAGSKRSHEQVDRDDDKEEGEQERSPKSHQSSASASRTQSSKRVAEKLLLPCWVITLSAVIDLSKQDHEIANRSLSLLTDRFQYLERLYNYAQDMETGLLRPRYPVPLQEDHFEYIQAAKNQLFAEASDYLQSHQDRRKRRTPTTASSSSSAASATIKKTESKEQKQQRNKDGSSSKK